MECSRSSIVEITFAELCDKHYDLIESNYKETGFFKEEGLDLNLAIYFALEAKGMLKVLLVKNDEKAIGYCTLFLDNFLHYKDQCKAQVDTIFVLVKYRSIALFKSMLDKIESLIRANSIKHFIFSASALKDIGPLLRRYGFSELEVVYYKGL